MAALLGIDHVANTVADFEATWACYDRLFGTEISNQYASNGIPAPYGWFSWATARGSASIRPANGVNLVAARLTLGFADICFRWGGPIAEAQAQAAALGQFPRSDGNLIELMLAD